MNAVPDAQPAPEPAPAPARADAVAPLAAVSALLLGHAIQVHGAGPSGGAAFVWLSLALVTTVTTFALARRDATWLVPERALSLALLCGLAWQVGQLVATSPGVDLHPGRLGYAPFALAAGLAAVVAACAGERSPFGRAEVPLLVGAFAAAGAWMLLASPRPPTDVWVFQQQSLHALVHGRNPYAATLPNIYGPRAALFYGPGLFDGSRVLFGYPYPPLDLLLTLPAYLLAGDCRWAHLAALAAAGALVACTRPAGAGKGRSVASVAAALLLFSPRTFYVLEVGWTDPLTILGLAATIYCAVRAPRYLPLALGLLLASKQYLVVAVPLAVLLAPSSRPQDATRFLGRALLVAAAVTAPLVLWSPAAFVHSAIDLHLRQPFRPDSLSYLALAARAGGPQIGAAIAFALLVPLAAWALARLPRTPASFCVALALMLLVFFAFNKQAFPNYYLVVVAALLLAVVVAGPAGEARPGGR